MRVHVLQVAYDDAETPAERVERVAALVAAQNQADLVVLPELWAPGGFSYREWTARAEGVDGPTVAALSDAARAAGAVVHAGSIIERATPGPGGRGLWNTSVLLGPDGRTLATYRKIHRFGFGAGEPLLLEAGENVVTVDVVLAGTPVTTGLSTCYDLRFPELYRAQVEAGASLLLIPAAWPAARVAHWSLLGRARALENQCVVVQCNTAGTHARTRMGGRSQIVAADGDVIAEAGEEQEVLVADVDLDAVPAWRADFPVLADRRL